MWRPLTREDILTKLSGDELASIEAQLEASGVELSALIGQAINRVRGFISAHPANTLGPEGTLPERIIADVVAWLIPELYGHTAGLLD